MINNDIRSWFHLETDFAICEMKLAGQGRKLSKEGFPV